MVKAFAIDFGTSNSLLAASSANEVLAPIPIDPQGIDKTVMRSLMYFPSSKKVHYGTAALTEYMANQGNGRLIRSIKKHLPFRSFIGTWIEDRPMNLEDLIGLFLAEMRKRANAHFQSDITRVVLGRPARFAEDDGDDKYAESRLEIAAKKAGFTEIVFVPEPIAAAFEFRTTLREEKIVFVADFGGGTSDFTVMKMSRAAYHPSDVLSLGGVSRAGDALDGSVMRYRLAPYFGANVTFQIPFSSNVLTMPKHLTEKICSPADVSILMKRDIMDFLKNVEKWALQKTDKEKMKRLFCLVEDQLGFPIFEKIESAKRELSENPIGNLEYEYPGIEIHEKLNRAEFDEYIGDSIHSILNCLDETLRKSGLSFSQIDLVCATGGTAKVPRLREALIERFGKEKLQEHKHFHSVVQGLAQHAFEVFR